MKKYFGILNNEKVSNLEVEKLLDFYTKKGLFNISHSYSIDISTIASNDKIVSPQVGLKPTQEVINTFYDFLKEQLSRNINQQFLMFFNDFNERIFGLGKKEQRKSALKRFNKLYNKTKVLEASFVKKEKDDKGVELVKNMNRFDFLKGRQNGQKQQLATTENILQFLNGNDDYFKSEQFNNSPNTKSFIEFEANLKILVSLNGQYKFEDDFHFNDLAKLKNLFAKYADTFKSLEVFIATHKKIHSFKEAKIPHITSLYDALFEMDLVYDNKTNFLNYLNWEHQTELIKLKCYEPEQNKKHNQRVQQFKLELQEHLTEKLKFLPQEVEKPYINSSNKKRLKTFTDKDALDYLLKNTFNCE